MCQHVQVVVDSDATAKALLERGQLTKRVTIIPLNQVCVSLWGSRPCFQL
jgi:hypothetical protein